MEFAAATCCKPDSIKGPCIRICINHLYFSQSPWTIEATYPLEDAHSKNDPTKTTPQTWEKEDLGRMTKWTCCFTHPKANMKPQNWRLEDDFSFQTGDFQVNHVYFPGWNWNAERKVDYPTVLQRVASLRRCVQFCVLRIMLQGSDNNLQQHDWTWCDDGDDGDDDDDDDDDDHYYYYCSIICDLLYDDKYWFVKINVVWFSFPILCRMNSQTPVHSPKTFHVHVTFACRLCFSANRQGHWMPGHI